MWTDNHDPATDPDQCLETGAIDRIHAHDVSVPVCIFTVAWVRRKVLVGLYKHGHQRAVKAGVGGSR